VAYVIHAALSAGGISFTLTESTSVHKSEYRKSSREQLFLDLSS